MNWNDTAMVNKIIETEMDSFTKSANEAIKAVHGRANIAARNIDRLFADLAGLVDCLVAAGVIKQEDFDAAATARLMQAIARNKEIAEKKLLGAAAAVEQQSVTVGRPS